MKLGIIKALTIGCFIWAVSLLIWQYKAVLSHQLSIVIPSLKYVYLSDNAELLKRYKQAKAERVEWQYLIPPKQRAVIQKYQVPTAMNLAENILLSINASTDETYRDTMFSTDVVDEWLGKMAYISGFIVPLEIGDNQQLQSFFFVPYFGACTHYPPPPPNQMIYVRVEDSMAIPDLSQAYTIAREFRGGLYEDMLGTSAYQLTLVSIEEYNGQPDGFRLHN